MDEEFNSKLDADETSVEGSIPSASVNKRSRVKPQNASGVVPSYTVYRLNLFKPSGGTRADIPVALIKLANLKWPNLIKSISSDIWVTREEIFTSYRLINSRRYYEILHTLDAGLAFLIESTIVISKEIHL